MEETEAPEKEESSEPITEKVKEIPKAYWMLATGALAIILIIVLFTGFSLTGNVTGATIGTSEAGQIVSDFAKAQGVEAEVTDVQDIGDLYEVSLSIQGQPTAVHLTKDGEYFGTMTPLLDQPAQQQTPTQTQQTPQNIQKSDKPKVELFIMSHCPYGTQMEKGIIPVVKELKDNIDFEIKFVNYAMHPTQGEVEEQLNQYCIQKEQNSKYLDYLSCFLEDGDRDKCLKDIKIDTSKLKTCTDKTDKEFDVIKNLEDKSSWSSGRFPKFMIHDADNQKYGVKGSPTLIINEQKAQSGRDAQNILNTICSAFTTKPEECNTDMTSFGTPAPGFGFGTQGGSATTAGCGA